jgi:hypothetical protein
MKEVESFRWFLPPKAWDGPKAKPYLSAWTMTAEEAAKRGALRPDPSTRTVLLVPETPEEEAQLRRASDTSALGGPAPGSPSDLKGKR